MAKVRGRKSWVGFLNRLKLHDKVEVTAKDHTTLIPWYSFEEVKHVETDTISQAGYYVNHDKDIVRVSGFLSEGQYKYVHLIPIANITSIKRLR